MVSTLTSLQSSPLHVISILEVFTMAHHLKIILMLVSVKLADATQVMEVEELGLKHETFCHLTWPSM
jgi:hypothetical protein